MTTVVELLCILESGDVITVVHECTGRHTYTCFMYLGDVWDVLVVGLKISWPLFTAFKTPPVASG